MTRTPLPDAAPPVRRKAAAIFMVAVVAVDAMGIGLIMPVIPELLAGIAGLSPAEAAPWGGWMAFAYAASIFLFGPLMGDLSDRFGRRPVLMAALAALAVDYLIAAAADALWLLILARAVSGMAGATYATATAYLADITPPERRAAAFGLVGAGFGAGFVLGPSLGGLLGELGPRAPFLAAAGICAAMAVVGLATIPESLPPERRRRFDWRRSDPFSALRGAARLPGLRRLLLAAAVFELGFGVYPAVWSFYLIETQGWSPARIGLSLALVGLALAFTQGALLGPVAARLGERGAALLALGASLAGMAVFMVTPAEWLIFAALPLVALGAMAAPAITALASLRTEEDAQGRLQGVMSSLQALTAAAAPPLFTAIFALSAPAGAAGAPFALGGLLTLAAMAILLAGRRG